jgi:hypothetical protein
VTKTRAILKSFLHYAIGGKLQFKNDLFGTVMAVMIAIGASMMAAGQGRPASERDDSVIEVIGSDRRGRTFGMLPTMLAMIGADGRLPAGREAAGDGSVVGREAVGGVLVLR